MIMLLAPGFIACHFVPSEAPIVPIVCTSDRQAIFNKNRYLHHIYLQTQKKYHKEDFHKNLLTN